MISMKENLKIQMTLENDGDFVLYNIPSRSSINHMMRDSQDIIEGYFITKDVKDSERPPKPEIHCTCMMLKGHVGCPVDIDRMYKENEDKFPRTKRRESKVYFKRKDSRAYLNVFMDGKMFVMEARDETDAQDLLVKSWPLIRQYKIGDEVSFFQ